MIKTGLMLALFVLACNNCFSTDSPSTVSDDVLDATIDFDIPLAIDNTQSIDEKSTQNWLTEKLRLSFGYQVGTEFNRSLDLVSNRLDTRLRWENLFSNQYFFSLDGKVIFRGWHDQQLDANENVDYDLRLRDFSLQSNFSSLSIKVGFQSIVWGEMDSVAINDVMTPWDFSEFAFTAPEDARVSQFSILGDLYLDNTTISIVATPYPLANRFPGGEASDLLTQILGTDQYQVNEDFPQIGNDFELGLLVKHTAGPSDIAVYGAHVISDIPRFDQVQSNNNSVSEYNVSYETYEMVGLSSNYGINNWLWKIESAFKHKLYFPMQTAVYRNTLDLAVGFDYNANNAYSLTIELYNQTILPGDGTLVGYKTHNSQILTRWSKTFLHETLSLIYFFSYQLQYGDMTHSGAIQYAINDYWQVDLNATVFEIKNADSPMRFSDDWDQLSLRLTLVI